MLRLALIALPGLLSFDPLRRIVTLERITQTLLWRRPQHQIERHLEIPPPLPSEAIEGAKLYANRFEMLDALPKGGTVAEVGTWKGTFAKAIAERCHPDQLHLIDIDFSPLSIEIPMETNRHEGDSSTVLRSFPEAYFDWIYVDGDHSYSGVTKDLEAAHRALKAGGFLMCNDYTNWMSTEVAPYGVARAVNELIIAEGYSVEGFALATLGNPDLLIRKPMA